MIPMLVMDIAGTLLKTFIENSKTGTTLRHGLTTVGGALVGVAATQTGVGSVEALTDLGMQIEAIIGGAVAILGIYASLKARFASPAVK